MDVDVSKKKFGRATVLNSSVLKQPVFDEEHSVQSLNTVKQNLSSNFRSLRSRNVFFDISTESNDNIQCIENNNNRHSEYTKICSDSNTRVSSDLPLHSASQNIHLEGGDISKNYSFPENSAKVLPVKENASVSKNEMQTSRSLDLSNIISSEINGTPNKIISAKRSVNELEDEEIFINSYEVKKKNKVSSTVTSDSSDNHGLDIDRKSNSRETVNICDNPSSSLKFQELNISVKMKRKLDGSNYGLDDKVMKTDTTTEPDIFNFIPVPSLESIATITVATALCKQSDIRDAIWQLSIKFGSIGLRRLHTFHNCEVNEIVKNIIENVSLLPLPNLLKAKASNCIEHIVMQILKWIHNQKDVEYLDSICWTNEGTVDERRTLKQLIDEDTGQHVQSYYELACTYCLEESIPNLWDKLPGEIKEYYLHRVDGINLNYWRDYLIAYWTYAVNNQLSLFSKLKPSVCSDYYWDSQSFYHNMFELALEDRYCLAAQYFWNKLSDAEISQNLKQLAYHEIILIGKVPSTNLDVLHFLLSKMNVEEEQGEILQQYSDVILNSLLVVWPWQIFLLPTIRRMWNFLDEKVYVALLKNIASQIKEGKTTEQLFNILWNNSPVNLKKYFIHHMLRSRYTDILRDLLIVKDIGTINAVLDYANDDEQKRIVFSLIANRQLFKVICANSLSTFCILIERFSESYINCFKKRITFMHGNDLCRRWMSDNNCGMVDSFLKWAFSSQDKIDDYKNTKMNRTQITYDLIYHERNYTSVNKFMNWCFDSEEKINRFKIYFATTKPGIVEIGSKDWCSFEKFIDWCFDSEQEINDFKSDVLQSYEMLQVIFTSIAYSYNFEFIDKLISWCCHSSEEIRQYKSSFVFTTEWMGILQKFVTNDDVSDSHWNNWELVKKLIKLFSPLEAEIISALKAKIATCIDFDIFCPDKDKRSIWIEEKHLFCLLDDYNVCDNKSCSENVDTDSDEDPCCS